MEKEKVEISRNSLLTSVMDKAENTSQFMEVGLICKYNLCSSFICTSLNSSTTTNQSEGKCCVFQERIRRELHKGRCCRSSPF